MRYGFAHELDAIILLFTTVSLTIVHPHLYKLLCLADASARLEFSCGHTQ